MVRQGVRRVATIGLAPVVAPLRGGGAVLSDPRDNVSELVVRPVHGVLALELVSDLGAVETLSVTPEHPFMTSAGTFVEAGDLTAGDIVDTMLGAARVQRISWIDGERLVYNFEVDGTHTYFVGDLGAWVHNANCGPKTPINRGQSKAPKTSEPNSIYEKQNAHGGNDVVSRTFYDDNGRPFARQDFEPGHGVPGPHEHNMTFSPDGRPLTPETVGPVPPGYHPEPTP
jgi:hypothetical protein